MISRLFKKVTTMMMAIPLLFVFAGGMSAVSAAEDSKTLDYSCPVLDGLVTINMKVEANGTVPDAVEPNEEFHVSNSYTTVTMDQDATNTLRGLANPFSGEVTTFNLIAQNAVNTNNPDSNVVNVAEPNIPIPETPVPEEGEGLLSFTVPEGGTEAGPFTAGESGDVIIEAGTIVTEINVSGEMVPVNCEPQNEDIVVHEIPIEEPDTEAPVITLNGDDSMELEVGDTYEEPGATAEDNEDGDVTDAIEISGDVNTDEPGDYTVTYTVFDEEGNEATAERTVTVVEPEEESEEDTVAPEIALNGDKSMELEVGDTYEEPGATAEDSVDGNLTDSIDISGEVDTSTPGEYTVTYTVSDEAGNVAEETRVINVVEPEEESDENNDDSSNDSDNESDEESDESSNGTSEDNGDGGELPDTATNNSLLMLIGSLIATAGGGLVFVRKKLMA